MYRIPGLVMRYIGLGLLAVILYTLFCLLGGYACGLGRYPHFVLRVRIVPTDRIIRIM